jgi:hypothetical protein
MLAALSFAGLLALTVATVAIRTASLRARARIERLAIAVQARAYELEHKQRALVAATAPPVLAELLRASLLRAREE